MTINGKEEEIVEEMKNYGIQIMEICELKQKGHTILFWSTQQLQSKGSWNNSSKRDR